MRLVDRRPPFAGLANLTEQQLQSLPTPCYLLDEAQLRRNGQIMLELQQRTGCRALLAQKAFSNFDVYPVLAPYLAGTEASGLYESRLGREQLPEKENHVFCAAYRVSVVCLFLVSMYIMGIMPQNFFPSMDKPYFRADCFLPEGFSIRESEDMMSDIEAYLLEQDEKQL